MVVLSVFGCDSKSYKVKAEGFENVKNSYKPGEKVKINFPYIATDTDYYFYVDGAKYNAKYENDKGYVIEFVMPEHDVEVRVDSKNSMEMLDPYQDIVKITYQRMWESMEIGETEDRNMISQIMWTLNRVVISDKESDISVDDYGDLIIVEYEGGLEKTYYFEENYYVDRETNKHYEVTSGLKELRNVLSVLIKRD